MPRVKKNADGTPVNTGITVVKPKTVGVQYANESGEVLMNVIVDTTGYIHINEILLSDAQLRDLRSRISASLNSRK